MYNKYLYTFVIVVESGSFSKAADVLFFSSVAVMKQINHLEEHLGVQLIERTVNGITVTEKGKLVYKEAKKLISNSDAFLRNIRSEETKHIIVKVGLSKIEYLSDFPQIIRKMNNESSDVQIDIEAQNKYVNTMDELSSVLNEQYDCVYMSKVNQELKDLEYKHLKYANVSFAIPIDSPLSKKRSIKLNDLKDQTIVVPGQLNYSTIDNFVKELQEKQICEVKILNNVSGIELYSYCVKNNYLLIGLDDYDWFYPFAKIVAYNPIIRISRGIYYKKENTELIKKFIREYIKYTILYKRR